MLKKFTDEKIEEILETGIEEFGEKGVDGASINSIAGKAGVSVGVLYKYYGDKDGFFKACLKRSLDELSKVLHEEIGKEDKLLGHAEKLIRTLQKYSREYSSYIKMYNEITSGSNQKYAKYLAEEIEGISSEIYTDIIETAMKNGDVRRDMDPRMMAFFFDSLLMIMQFSYCSDYYRERFKVYCGDDIMENDEKVIRQLLMFFESAFTFEQSQVVHRGTENTKDADEISKYSADNE